jgi:MoaA/NifB/PqqE/SkfB family radical SAM enzyme
MRAPFHINWNITYHCAFNCRHCYSRERAKLEELDIRGKLQVAKNICDSRVFSVNLGGGEPLCSDDTLPIIRYLADNNVITALSSNGWDIGDTEVQELKGVGLATVYLSLDDIRQQEHDKLRGQPGSYASCLKAAELFANNGIDVVFSVVLTSLNYSVLEGMIRLAEEYDCAGIEFKRLKLYGNAADCYELELNEEQRVTLFENIARWKAQYAVPVFLVYGAKPVEGIDAGCPCGKTSLCILADGSIAPCVYNPQIIGNATVDSIADLWVKSAQLKRLRENFSCIGMESEHAKS